MYFSPQAGILLLVVDVVVTAATPSLSCRYTLVLLVTFVKVLYKGIECSVVKAVIFLMLCLFAALCLKGMAKATCAVFAT